MLIVQVDMAKDSFIAAFDIKTGKELWRTPREEVASFSSPIVWEGPVRTEILTVATNFARGYDPATGKELWRLGKQTTHATPIPVMLHDLIFIANGTGGTIQPIYAMRQGAEGNVTLGDDETTNNFIVWSKRHGGPYLTTPIIYDDLLYICADPGVLSAYDAITGERAYQQRLPLGGGGHNYTASAVAADGKIYYATQDGDTVVVKAGPKFEQLAVNSLGEPILATPAITGDMVIIRTQHHVFAVGDTAAK
jgi:outer membrane protein assembly factor BamB